MDLQALTAQNQSFANKAAITPANEAEESNESGSFGTLANATNQSEEFDTFINLLTAQVRNQDPLAPLDSTQFVEQLATFTNLELQAKNNQLLEQIAAAIISQGNAAPATPDAAQPAEGGDGAVPASDDVTLEDKGVA